MAGFLITERLDAEEVKNGMYMKALEKFPRLRSTIGKKFGFYYWKAQPALKAINQVRKVSREMHTHDELIRYTEEIFETKFLDDDFQWFIDIVEDYQPGKSAMFLKMHHSMSDAMGVIGLFSFLNNNATHNSIPQMRKPSVLWEILIWFTFPYYCLQTLWIESK